MNARCNAGRDTGQLLYSNCYAVEGLAMDCSLLCAVSFLLNSSYLLKMSETTLS